MHTFKQSKITSQLDKVVQNPFETASNYSEIVGQDFEEDSLFGGNGFKESFFHGQEKCPKGKKCNEHDERMMKVTKMGGNNKSLQMKNQSAHSKILEILEYQDQIYKEQMRGRKTQAKDRYNYINNAKPKHFVLKPKIDDSIPKSHTKSLKVDKKPTKNVSQNNLKGYLHLQKQKIHKNEINISKRFKTQSYQDDSQCQFNKNISSRIKNNVCKTQYQQNYEERHQKLFNIIQSEKDSLECTFKPTNLKNCLQQINQNKIKSEIRQKKGLNPKNDKNSRSKTKITDKSCIQKKSLHHISGCALDVATRNKMWLEQKQQKLKRKRQEDEEQKLKRQQFSYKPEIREYKGQQGNSQLSKFGQQGMQQYFERLSIAKKKLSIIRFKKQENSIIKQLSNEFKENIPINIQKQNLSPFGSKIKQPKYEMAVKDLHQKIMKMKI